jgi:acetoacetate decarboxylase
LGKVFLKSCRICDTVLEVEEIRKSVASEISIDEFLLTNKFINLALHSIISILPAQEVVACHMLWAANALTLVDVVSDYFQLILDVSSTHS